MLILSLFGFKNKINIAFPYLLKKSKYKKTTFLSIFQMTKMNILSIDENLEFLDKNIEVIFFYEIRNSSKTTSKSERSKGFRI